MSMVQFKRIRWKNLMSYGNMWTEIQLDRSPSTMILGGNGSGKSTLTDALMFGLFGKPFRKVKKGQLINTKAGREALVEIEFVTNGDEYLIRRGIKPDVFEVIKNGVLLNQEASSRDYQKELETKILRMTYDAAGQLMCVGKAQHKPFMQLDSKGRRQFVEVILNLTVFSNMLQIHSARSTKLKNLISELKSGISVSKEKIKLRQRFIDDLKSADVEQQRKQQEKLNAQLKQVIAELEKLHAKRAEITSDVDPVDKKQVTKVTGDLRKHTTMLVQMDTKLSDITKRLTQLNTETDCYACKRPLDQDKIGLQVTHLTTQQTALLAAKDDLTHKIAQFEQLLTEFERVNEKYEEYLNRTRDVDAAIRHATSKQADIESELAVEPESNAAKIEAEEAELAKLVTLNERLTEKYHKESKDADYMALIGTMLQDKGIKSMLIRRFIPIINTTMNRHLASLGLFAKFTLDEAFEETIQARGFDTLGYNSFSEGEKLRMDMALLLAWRDIAKMQGNVSTNLLIFDEIFDSSLDSTGSESLADMLTHTSDLNVFIITHTPEKIMDKVRSVIRIERHEGFSRIMTGTTTSLIE